MWEKVESQMGKITYNYTSHLTSKEIPNGLKIWIMNSIKP